MHSDRSAVHVAAILNAAWQVRYWTRPHQDGKKAQALSLMAAAVRAALNDGLTDPEAILYAIAVGLYDRTDSRFIP